MTTITQNPNTGLETVECAFPVSSYKKAQTLKERRLVAMRASEQSPPVEAPKTNARELWLAMTPAEQKAVVQSQPNSIERFYREKLGISEVEICDPLDRSTRVHRNGKSA